MLIDLITKDGKIGTRIKETYIKKHHYKYWLEINEFVKKYGYEDLIWKQRVYNYMYNITELPICPNCGGLVNFRCRTDQLYATYCSPKCCGEYNIDKSAIIRKDTVNAKYGCDNVFQLDEIKEKIMNTSLEKYGCEYPNQSKMVKDKIIQTCREKYNVDYYLQSDISLEKRKQTNLVKYGNVSPFGNGEVKEKIKQTMLVKYGVEHPMHSEEIKRGMCETNIQRYGCDNPSKNKEIIEKIKQNVVKFHINDDRKPELRKEQWNIDVKYLGNGIYSFICPDCGEYQELDYHFISNRVKHNHIICSKCNPPYSSMSENEINTFVNELGFECYKNRKGWNYELDVYIPELSIGIEYNGLYWHSEDYKERTYHLDKKKYFEELSIDLIQIWEDDWQNKKDIVKSLIKTKIKKSDLIIESTECEIFILDQNNSKIFFNENHISGYLGGELNIGLLYNNDVISMMLFKKGDNDNYELVQFGTLNNTFVIGGYEKIFNYFKSNYKSNLITTYSDNVISNEKIYTKLGFETDNNVIMDYYWFKGNTKYVKNYFNNTISLMNEQTIDDILYERGYVKIYTAGLKKWTYRS